MTDVRAPFARFAWDYMGVVEILRERADHLEISRLEIDRLSGVPDGYAGKVLCIPPMKGMGLRSLGPMLSTLGLMLVVIEDPAARDRTLARREQRSAKAVLGAQAKRERKRLEQVA